MMRVLFWTVLLILVVAAVRSKLRSSGFLDGGKADDKLDARNPGQRGDIESMAQCAHCHVHFPASEAVSADGRAYCSPAHVRLPPL